MGRLATAGECRPPPGQRGRTHHSSAARPCWVILSEGEIVDFDAFSRLAPASRGSAQAVRVSSGQGAGPMPFTHTISPGVWRGTDAPVDTNAGPRSAVKRGRRSKTGQISGNRAHRPPLEPSGPSCASHHRAGRGVDRPVRGACTSLGQGGGQEGRGQGRVSLAASGGCKSAPVLPCCGPRRALGLVHIMFSDDGIPGNHLTMTGPV